MRAGKTKKKPTAAARARKAERLAREFARKYGSEERVQEIRRRTCCVCKKEPAENVHTENGGTGRKAGWETIVDLGANCHTLDPRSLHRLGSVEAFDREHATDLRARARYLAALIPAGGSR
jgi:hypothetical protein